MTNSMTAFASGKGHGGAGFSWTWELRSVNAKGLDLRLRVPDWVTGLEAGLRAALSATLARGSVTLSLRLTREDEALRLGINQTQLSAVLEAMAEVEETAMARGVSLAPATAADILGQRGVLEQVSGDEDPAPLKKALLTDFEAILADFCAMRATEGAALQEVLLAQLDSIDTLTDQAAAAALARRDEMQANLQAALARVTENSTAVDPARVAQELALIAVKADITEELDRLKAHVTAARDLIASDGPVGRKLDFLSQEFNREANTLCSKSQSKTLTAIGLELKAVIDQMREQVQNVE
ncbi:YicC/YloC family endoribonuclease [Rhodalgimonas zhirmunskyi]|uniref:YicC family protein n=1 Tax=Rhodalgimonas zhirmunskyi TaxID=2964767 RepID=A0AAJ1X457_9RHOB|nr:YicC/YloC family endoribonuclease [Rhodoalgimonas zhirmunskyi]MDQ2092779.1 YicC family protein [Rhodoalgimonas zhirmunskyi]